MKKAKLGVLSALLSILVYAQDAEVDVNIGEGGGGSAWYMNPIAWVIGAAIFILLLVALLRGGRR
jgi:hypothetical protein